MSNTKTPSSLDVIVEMVNANDPGCRMAPLTNVTKADIRGTNGYFTVGVPAEDVHNWMNDKTGYGGLFLVDSKAFQKCRDKMIENATQPVDTKTTPEALQQEISDLNQSLDEMTEARDTAKAQVLKLQEEVEELKPQVETVDDKLAYAFEERDEARNEAARLRQEVKEYREALEGCHDILLVTHWAKTNAVRNIKILLDRYTPKDKEGEV